MNGDPNDTVDVAIVGAGPYGLSLGAHLRAAGIPFRQFGLPMQLWREAMPAGMFLKSQGYASNLSDPAGEHTLRAFCRSTGRDYADYGLPVPLETFVAYGDWFQRAEVPHLEELMVIDVTRVGGRQETGPYEITLADGTAALARRVVVASGVQHFAHLPGTLVALPAQVCTHTCAHDDLRMFAGREVAVVGAGQSALESAALLHESGASVTVLARTPELVWNSAPLPERRSIRRRLREPEAPLGSGWSTWFYSTQPDLFRRLSAARRVRTARSALGPAGAYWLRPRVEGKIRTLVGHSVRWAEHEPWGVRLGLRVNGGSNGAVNGGDAAEITVEHVLSATGYRADLDRLIFLDAALRSRVRTLAGSPDVGPDFQSSVPDLYFIGPAVAPTFGPVMRFVYGADYAARAVTRALTTAGAHR
ncbi:MAG: NAD(P)-binding domain-containing protein [Pseudonocardiales bacterium]|nr:NAD(P)-binding domain-containing protein [Pseudonocardiales bacterium]MBV9029882.1 NAD(P)-binding domain-containing protein [Pseudonocardiales bacterium]